MTNKAKYSTEEMTNKGETKEVENKDPESRIEKLRDEQRASNNERQETSAAFLKWEHTTAYAACTTAKSFSLSPSHNPPHLRSRRNQKQTSSSLPQKPEAKIKRINRESNTGPIEFRDI